MNVSLTPELEKYVRGKVASGLYNNASEVVREALRAQLGREASVTSRSRVLPPQKAEVVAKLTALEQPLRQRGVKALAVFGSVSRDAAGPDSDVDVLVDLEPGVRFSLFDLAALADFLGDHLKRKVDVVTRAGLDPGIRDHVLSEAQTVF